ncbi:hypothetical protein HZU77_001300 [Neisseriaceae bacterium TC5R-5]|nr:hypothetical protein [Neisseriaceae bacterium TC5R-5]
MSTNNHKNKKKAHPQQQARRVQEKRWNRAEHACSVIMNTISQTELAPLWEQHEIASQYLQMAAVYYKKVRNGKVINAGDFNLAADVANCVRKALLSLDLANSAASSLQLASLEQVMIEAESILADMQQLKTGA